MNNIDNSINRKVDEWIRPWNTTKFDDLYNRDERFFSIIVKGVLSFLNRNILMYNKSINHYIFNTGSSYMYVENNGYEFSWNETSGEDYIYMQLPRCITEIGNINIDMNELTQGFARGNYERKVNNVIQEFNAEIKRIPIELNLTLHYVLSNFNECIILIQELIDVLTFQKYFKVNYLGNIIQCSIELPQDFTIQLNKIDLAAADTAQRTIDVAIKICTNYPLINTNSEISTSKIISSFSGYITNHSTNTDITILIDGKEIEREDILLDLRKYNLNNDDILDEDDLILLNDFIHDFDLDNDGEVTQHDLSMIEEIFINNTYDIKFDILNKGQFDKENLYAIYKLFAVLDLNHDNVVSEYEVQKYTNMLKLIKYDFDNNLIIDYNDLDNLIKYVSNNLNTTYQDLMSEFISYFNAHINKSDMFNDIIDILNNNYKDILIWLSQCSYKDDIDDIVFTELYKLLEKILLFLTYDLKHDQIINDEDIDEFIKNIGTFTNKEISYKASSNIIIHQNDSTLSDSSTTDKINI